jgi:hypothetical protein
MKYKIAKPEDFQENDKGYVFQLGDAYNKTYFDLAEVLVGIDCVIDSFDGKYSEEWGLKHLKKMQSKFTNPDHTDS